MRYRILSQFLPSSGLYSYIPYVSLFCFKLSCFIVAAYYICQRRQIMCLCSPDFLFTILSKQVLTVCLDAIENASFMLPLNNNNKKSDNLNSLNVPENELKHLRKPIRNFPRLNIDLTFELESESLNP